LVEEQYFQIGEAAARVELSLRTIRHYDEVGLVRPSGHTSGGFRLYSEADVERLRIVKGMKPAGLTLDEMRELLELLEGRVSDTERLEHFLDATDTQVARLERHRAAVEALGERIRASLRTGKHAVRR
jgi:MerR family transcriptional regulator, copper efflux regulator